MDIANLHQLSHRSKRDTSMSQKEAQAVASLASAHEALIDFSDAIIDPKLQPDFYTYLQTFRSFSQQIHETKYMPF
jgi:hypothetical protein